MRDAIDIVLCQCGQCATDAACSVDQIAGCKNAGKSRTYTVSQKTVQKYFCHKFVKCLPTLIIFGTQIAQRIGLREVYSFSTSPN